MYIVINIDNQSNTYLKMANPEKLNGSIKDPLLWNPSSNLTPRTNTGNLVPKDLISEDHKYSTLSYPQNLGSQRYPFFMMIYVNASTKSKLVASGAAETNLTDTTNRKVNNSITSATSGTFLAGETKIVGQADNFATSPFNAILAAAQNLQFEPTKKRLKTSIALPIPDTLSFPTDIGYRQVSGGGFLGSVLHNAGNGDWNGVMRAGAEGAIQALGRKLKDDKEDPQSIGAIMMKARGVAKNDRKEQIFEGVNTRQFQFQWNLFPRNLEESEIIHDIVKFLRFHMHPEIDTNSGGMNFIIPDEFDIEFHHYELGEIGGDKNHGLPKITTCVLKSVHMNAAPLGSFVAFDGTSHPVGVQISMMFEELEPLTRKEIGMGY